MYLLATDLTADVTVLIQYYLFRWEIEVTHRELKNDLGIGEAQVRNEQSVKKCPQTIGLANSIIILAHTLLEKGSEGEHSCPTIPIEYYKDNTASEGRKISPFFNETSNYSNDNRDLRIDSTNASWDSSVGIANGYAMPPKWYKNRKRISLAYMRRRLRQEMTDNPSSRLSWRDLVEAISA